MGLVEMPASTFLMTGVTGFVGNHFASYLLQRGHQVIGITRDESHVNVSHLRQYPLFESIHIKLTEPTLIEKLSQYPIEYVCHLSGSAITNAGWDVIADANITQTVALFKALSQCRRLRAVFMASTSQVYGPTESRPLTEVDIVNPLTPYAMSKVCAEHMAAQFVENTSIPVTIGRLTNVYGPGDPHSSRIIPSVINHLKQGYRPVINGSGRDLRDFIYISDVIEAIMAILVNSKGTFQIVNIGSGQAIRIRDLVDQISKLCGRPIIPQIQRPHQLPIHYQVSINKLQSMYQWQPKVSFSEGIMCLL